MRQPIIKNGNQRMILAMSSLLMLSIAIGTASAATGLNAEYMQPSMGQDPVYAPNNNWSATPGQGITIVNRVDPNIDFNWGGTATGTGPFGVDDTAPWPFGGGDFSVDWTGYINIPVDGNYEFATYSHRSSIVYIDNNSLFENTGGGGGCQPLSYAGSSITLTKGFHSIEVKYWEGCGIPAAIALLWIPPEGTQQIVPMDVLFTDRSGIITGTVTDTFTLAPISGATVTAGNNVTATTDASGGYSISITPGTYTVAASATGYYTANASVTVTSGATVTQNFFLTSTPLQKIQQLTASVQAQVASDVLNQGQGKALIVKLNAAMQNLNAENTTAAINELRAFINQVKANINSGKLTAVQGQALINGTNALMKQLGA